MQKDRGNLCPQIICDQKRQKAKEREKNTLQASHGVSSSLSFRGYQRIAQVAGGSHDRQETFWPLVQLKGRKKPVISIESLSPPSPLSFLHLF